MSNGEISISLDPTGANAHLAVGKPAVDDAGFLSALAAGSGRIHVIGPRLCRWAEEVAIAREYQFTQLRSPASELVDGVPGLTVGAADELLLCIGERIASLQRPLRPNDLAAALWPHDSLWHTAPEATHAVLWLAWLAEATPTPAEMGLLRQLCTVWRDEATDELRDEYQMYPSDHAWARLLEWYRLCDSARLLPAPPRVSLPASLRSRWTAEQRSATVQTQGQAFNTLARWGPAREYIKEAAEIAADFLTKNPSHATAAWLDGLRPHVSIDSHTRLRSFVPPPDPGEAPALISQLPRWYRSSYLPFREWALTHPSSAMASRIDEIARKFARWYLDFYSAARMGGAGGGDLSWARSAHLCNDRNAVTLLVVLDGLLFSDAENLAYILLDRSPRLRVDSLDVVFAPVPTVTEFAKPALLTGVHPTRALDESTIGDTHRLDSEIVKSLDLAELGQRIVWSLVEPDHIYHQGGDVSAMRLKVESWLSGLANRLAAITQQVRDTQALRVVVATDHGRLLANATRNQRVPTGMVAHGRASWGVSDLAFGKEGYVISGDVAYLDANRFGIPTHSAVLISGDAFLTMDGRGGIESFPHGGLYPEEVMIPWLELSRDAAPVVLKATLQGRNRPGTSGVAILEVQNSSQVRVLLRTLVLSCCDIDPLGDQEVGPMAKVTLQVQALRWPTSGELPGIRARLEYNLPSGSPLTMEFTPVLDVEEMYKRSNVLDNII